MSNIIKSRRFDIKTFLKENGQKCIVDLLSKEELSILEDFFKENDMPIIFDEEGAKWFIKHQHLIAEHAEKDSENGCLCVRLCDLFFSYTDKLPDTVEIVLRSTKRIPVEIIDGKRQVEGNVKLIWAKRLGKENNTPGKCESGDEINIKEYLAAVDVNKKDNIIVERRSKKLYDEILHEIKWLVMSKMIGSGANLDDSECNFIQGKEKKGKVVLASFVCDRSEYLKYFIGKPNRYKNVFKESLKQEIKSLHQQKPTS